ncbi:MAG: pyroglutamyl-peptidase I [Candidatus Thermoplasmatota archaeon]|nr:pyroglutamyl-peptidase I [Candidatus Thermoplasmatota archaeon]
MLITVTSAQSLLPTSMQQTDDLILITGFEPFSIYTKNPSEQVALQLNNTNIQNYTIKGYVLPVNYTAAPAKMKQLITQFQPSLIISLGLDGKANAICIEKIGINLRINPEAQFPLSTLKKVNDTGPWIQLATYDIVGIVNKIQQQGIAVEQSYSAGFYLCNAVLYETLFYQQEKQHSVPTGFIHLPPLKTQDPNGMSLEIMIQAVTAAISAQIST